VSTCTSKRQRSQHFVILLYPAKTSYKHVHALFLTQAPLFLLSTAVIHYNFCLANTASSEAAS